MKNSNVIKEKSYRFAIQVVTFCKKMQKNKEFVLSKQLLRSGTSIGANVEEAQQAQSRKDFTSKMNIALKEAYETRYWLRIILDTESPEKDIDALLPACEEIIRLLVSIVKSSKKST